MRIRTVDSRLLPIINNATKKEEPREDRSKTRSDSTKVEDLKPYLTFLKELTELQIRTYKGSTPSEEDYYLETLREEIGEFESWLQNLQEQNQS